MEKSAAGRIEYKNAGYRRRRSADLVSDVPTMGREALLTVLSCLILNNVSARVLNIATNAGILDNVGTTSVSRLYRNVPLGMYAGSAPYAAFSFQVPSFIMPKTNQVVPIKEENVVIQNSNGFLRDSYGNKFHETPQSLAYRTTIPQQYVQIQDLPAHLSQPLGISQNFQFKQATPHFFGPTHYTLSNVQGYSHSPGRFTISQPFIYAGNIGAVAPQSQQLSQVPKQSNAQQQPSSNKDVYVETHSVDKPSESKAQRVEQLSTPSYTTVSNEHRAKQTQQPSQTKTVPKTQIAKETSITTHVNGKKTVVNIRTKPPLPLLDLSLLEPLTFDNPLVPQVQHYLPRIHDAKYHKLGDVDEVKKHQMDFVVQNTKSYDSDSSKGKSKHEKGAHKRKHKKTRPRIEDDEEEVQPTPMIKVKDVPNESPEFTYEINSPNYMETVSEKKVSYNKETDSEPVSISYEKQTENEPVTYSYEKHTESKPIHYSYVHDSSKPEQIKEIYYHSDDEEPKQLVYHFNSNEENDKNKEERHSAPHAGHQPSHKDTSDHTESEKGHSGSKQTDDHNDHHENHNHESRSKHNPKLVHNKKSYNSANNENPEDHGNFGFNVHLNTPYKHTGQYFQAIVPEYEEDITILPTHKPHSNFHQNDHESHHGKNNNKQHLHLTNNYKPHIQNSNPQYAFAPTIHEKSKRIIIKEESPANTEQNDGKIIGLMIKQQEENEENFEKAYKDAAYGFPAYERSVDVEKEIYNPESYGASKYHSDIDIENTPLSQYQAEGDDYPQDSRSNYKDSRDKMKEEYFLDYAVSRPTSILDRYKNKESYYKMFEKQKPQRYYVKPDDKRKSAYTVESPFSYRTPKNQQTSAKLKMSPYLYEYDYAKEAPRDDNSEYATQPFERYKSNTQFVEPQFQYGFEPISIPRLLNSELAAMASNDNIESENPGTTKKIYKENFYIKKTTTAKGR